MPAPLAGVGADFANPRPVGFFLALRADMALTKAAVENVLDASVVVGKRGVKFLNRYAVLLVPVSIFHAPEIAQKPYLRQGDSSG
jgi:hypothetical protein